MTIDSSKLRGVRMAPDMTAEENVRTFIAGDPRPNAIFLATFTFEALKSGLFPRSRHLCDIEGFDGPGVTLPPIVIDGVPVLPVRDGAMELECCILWC